jgi:catechol 2,3-dioxygenase-like lactoylglutathione lyase family enzyme
MAVLGINHVAFRSPDPTRLRRFYETLLDAEPLSGAHDPLRAGSVLLVFFPAERPGAAEDPDELAFDVDAAGFHDVLQRARDLGAVAREPVEHTAWSRGFLVRDPDGRRIEIVYDDRAVYWQD